MIIILIKVFKMNRVFNYAIVSFCYSATALILRSEELKKRCLDLVKGYNKVYKNYVENNPIARNREGFRNEVKNLYRLFVRVIELFGKDYACVIEDIQERRILPAEGQRQ